MQELLKMLDSYNEDLLHRPGKGFAAKSGSDGKHVRCFVGTLWENPVLAEQGTLREASPQC